MKKLCFPLVLLLVFGLACPAAARDVPAKDMTLMVYLCGSNLESNGGAATRDVAEMLHAGYDPDRMNVVLMAGGSEKWFCGFPSESSGIYYLNEGRPRVVRQSPRQNMGLPDTLSSFIRFARENYPAKRYGLILWDHGSGPAGGVCADAQFGGDSLTLRELQTALKDGFPAGERLAFIGFDAGLMAALETAMAVAPYADYMIASQESEPGEGWNYSFLKDIYKAWGKEIGRRIVNSYLDLPNPSGSAKTLSCVNLSKVEKLEKVVDRYFTLLAGQISEERFPEFVQGRGNARGFGGSVKAEQDYDLVDILSLARELPKVNSDAFSRLRWALNSAVTCSRSDIGDCCGLSLYHPYRNEMLFEKNKTEFADASLVPAGYQLYLNRYWDLRAGAAGARDWDILPTQSEDCPQTGHQRFMTPIPEQQQETFRSAQFVVLGRLPDTAEGENWAVVYSSPELQSVENGYLSWEYSGEGLYAADDVTGEILAGPIWNLRLDSGNSYYTVLRPETSAFTPASAVGDVLCRYEQDQNTGWFEERETLMYDEMLRVFTPRQSFSMADCPSVLFPNTALRPVFREDGTMLPLDIWQETPTYGRSREIRNESWHLEYRPGAFGDLKLYGCFLIRDDLNQTAMTQLCPVTIHTSQGE